MHTLTFWAVVQSDLLASGQNQTLAWSSNYGTILLDVLAIIFLLFGLFVFLSFLRKETSIRGDGGFRRPKNAGFQRSRSRAGLLSLAVLALPLFGLVFMSVGMVPSLFPKSITPKHKTASTPSTIVSPPPSKDLVKPGYLIVGTYTTYAPQEFIDSNGNKTGFDVVLANALALAMGLKLNLVSDQFNNLLPDLQHKQVDVVIAGIGITPDNQQKATFIPYLKSVEAFMVPNGNPNHFAKPADLCGKKVGVLGSSSAETDLKNAQAKCDKNNQITIITKDNTESVIQALQSSSSDVAYLDTPVADYYMSMSQYAGQFIIAGMFTETTNQGIAVRQKNDSIKQAVTRAFQTLQRDGTYTKLLKSNGWDFSSEAYPGH